MKRPPAFVRIRAIVVIAFSMAAMISPPAPSCAEEAYQKFLDGLREKGLHDMALEYLQTMRDSPLVPADLRPAMPYEEARILVEIADRDRDLTASGKHLDLARDRFNEFIQANSAHPLVPSAEIKLGQVLVVRSRRLMAQSERPSQAKKKDTLIGQARELLNQGLQVFTEAETKLAERWRVHPKYIDPKEVQAIAERDQLRTDLLEVRVFIADVHYELAKTYPRDSDESKKLLTQAAEKYDAIYEKYRKKLAGLYARVKQGRCHQDLGESQKAIGYYKEILTQSDQQELRRIKALAMHLLLQCLITEPEKKYEEAVNNGRQWLNEARGTEDREPDGLAIRYFTALALKLYAESLKPDEAGRKKTTLSEARKQASQAAKHGGDYQDAAKKLLQDLAGVETDDKAEPTTFAEARDQGQEKVDIWQGIEAGLKAADLVSTDGQNPDDLKRQAAEARQEAAGLFKLAMDLRDDEVPIDEVNAVRYLLCFLAYSEGHFYDAAVMGEFLATNYPEANGARQCAQIVMAAYLEGYRTAPEDKRDFDRDRMVAMADLITRRWAGEPEADEAWTLLMSVAITERDLEKANEHLAKIPLESPRRGGAELKAGQALWEARLAAGRLDEAQRPTQAQLDEMDQRARATLENGIARMRVPVDAGTAEVDATLATAALSLAQIYVGTGHPEQAVTLLNDAKIGALPLVAAKSEAAKRTGFDVEAYRAALRAYVGTEDLEKAEQVMNDLEALVAGRSDANAARMLTGIYVTLGRELEEQVARYRQDPAKAAQLAKVSRGFELFLERISKRETGNTFSSLNWVAQTFFSLASGYDAAGEAPREALDYYEKALATDSKILKAAEADPAFASGEALLGVRLRMARALRRGGRFKDAMDQLVEVLKQKPYLLDAQREAARTYQMWGAKSRKYYGSAILGARKSKDPKSLGQNMVWGWALLSNKVQNDPKFRDVWHEARYNLAMVRRDQALTKTGAERVSALEKAARDIIITRSLSADMGGPEWLKKYDSLLRTIQGAMGKSQTGLAKQSSTLQSPALQSSPESLTGQSSTGQSSTGQPAASNTNTQARPVVK